MNYGQQVLSRLMNPGVLLLVIGAVAVYGSGRITRRVAPDQGDRANLICKAVGGVIALIGAVLIFRYSRADCLTEGKIDISREGSPEDESSSGRAQGRSPCKGGSNMDAQNMEKTFNPQAIENDIYK